MRRTARYKQPTAFIFLAAFIIQAFSSSFTVADYYLRTAAYARQCENQARPQMHCNGKCQLMKKLNREENKDKQDTDRKGEHKTDLLSSRSFFPSITFLIISADKIFLPITSSLPIDRSFGIFHPPKKNFCRSSAV